MQSTGLNLRASKRQREQVFPPRAYKHIFYNGVCLTKLSKRPSLKQQSVPLLKKELPSHKTTARAEASKSSTHAGGGGTVSKKLPLKSQGPVCLWLKVLNRYLANVTEKYATKPSDIPMPGGWGKPEHSQG